jgi:hypothetical protein
MVQACSIGTGPMRMISRQFRKSCKTLAGANRLGMRLAAVWLVLPLCLPFHRAPGGAGEETGGIGGTGVAVEAGKINGATIETANRYGGATAWYDSRRKKDR